MFSLSSHTEPNRRESRKTESKDQTKVVEKHKNIFQKRN
jgi:hypothetical protein